MFLKPILKRFDYLASQFRASETPIGLTLAVIVGMVAGLAAVGFRWLIDNFQVIFFDGGKELFTFLGEYYVIIIPALGGLLVGPLVYFFAREARGHGVPEVMEAVALKGGRIRPRVSAVKALASSITIGSGGSVGREGPIVQIGASFGSTIAQWLKLPEGTVKILVACGAAGGIAATFNAPIAGVFFALEVILGRVVTRKFAYVVTSAVVASVIAQAISGSEPAFSIPAFGIVSPWEFLFYIALGITAAAAAVIFIKVLYKSEDLFALLKMPEYFKPILGGLAVGAIGFFNSDLFGVGYSGIDKALSGGMAISALLLVGLLKIIATSFTLGSGGSGGVFAPSLFIGAMLGTAVGTAVGSIFPDITAPAGAYGVVGMAAVFAGTARAPFTAILIIFEMTHDYAIMLPLMLTVAVSIVLSRAFKKESIYTLKLLRRGVDIEREEVNDIMRTISVKQAMTTDFPTVTENMNIDRLIDEFRKTGHHAFPVLDKNKQLIGIVTQTDVTRHLGTENLKNYKTVGDIATRSLYLAYPEQTLDKVLEATEEEYVNIPVVSRDKPRELLGVLRRQGIIRAYRKATKKQKLLKK